MKNEEVTQELINNLQQNKVNYLAFSNLKFSKGFLKHVGIISGSTVSKKIECIKPYLGDRLGIVTKGKTNYLAFKGANQDWITEYIEKHHGCSPKQVVLALKLLKQPDIIKELNAMVISGSIRMELTDSYSIKLSIMQPPPPVNQPEKTSTSTTIPPILTKDDRVLFREAFEEVERGVDRGRISIRIYNIRRKLDWERERFDTILEKLRDEAVIQLHGGDNTLMKKDEIDDSYIDDNGFLHITITWRKR